MQTLIEELYQYFHAKRIPLLCKIKIINFNTIAAFISFSPFLADSSAASKKIFDNLIIYDFLKNSKYATLLKHNTNERLISHSQQKPDIAVSILIRLSSGDKGCDKAK